MHKSLHEIEVPKEDVFHSIQIGIQRGKQVEKRTNRIKVTKRFGFFTSAAAALILASGFVFTPITNVLAQAPFLGGIYEKYQMTIAEKLASEELITEMSMIATDQNIHVEITSIFYDEAYVGITFKATGAVTDNIGGDRAPEAGYTYEMFDGEDTSLWGDQKGGLAKSEDGYTGAFILDVPGAVTDDVLSIPLTFTHMAGVRGEWSFDLEVEKLQSVQKEINQQVISKNKELSIKFHDIRVGQTNARIALTSNFDSVIEGQTFTFEAYDQNDKKLRPNQIGDAGILLDLPENITLMKVVPILQVNGTETERLEPVTIHLK